MYVLFEEQIFYTVYSIWNIHDFLGGAPVSSTSKTDHHDLTEILLKVVLNTLTPVWNKHYNIFSLL
jgi:hypothetical protein